MSNLSDDRKLILINIPGSHDSAAYNMHYFGTVFAQCQDLNIMGQLKAGTRKFDIRVTNNNCIFSCGINRIVEEHDYDIICCHGICNCYHTDEGGNKINLTLKSVLLDMKNFLEENPTEIIVYSMASGRGDKVYNFNRAFQIFEKIVGEISINYNSNLTIGECRGKIVKLNTKSELDQDGKINYNEFQEGIGLEEIHQKFVPDFTYGSFKVDAKLKIKEVEEFLNINNLTLKEAEKDLQINKKKYPFKYSISCTGEYESIIPLPRAQADIINKFILNYNLKKGNYYGWINIDFIEPNIAKKIIDTNFL